MARFTVVLFVFALLKGKYTLILIVVSMSTAADQTCNLICYTNCIKYLQLCWTVITLIDFLSSSFTESADAYTIESLSSEKHVLVGESAVISCKYSGLGPSFQWYRQYPGSRPEFLIFQTETSVSSEPTLRLTAIPKKEMTQVDLEISSAEVSDSAVYYCALRPTVTGNTSALYKNLILLLILYYTKNVTCQLPINYDKWLIEKKTMCQPIRETKSQQEGGANSQRLECVRGWFSSQI